MQALGQTCFHFPGINAQEYIFWYGYTHSLVNHSPVEDQYGLFPVWAITNRAATKTHVQIFV